MTQLTIDLAPELFAQLQIEAQRQGKGAPELARSVLTAHLAHATPAQPAYPALTPEVRELLASMRDDEMIVPPQGAPAAASQLLDTWSAIDAAAADEPEEGEGTWEDVLRAIDANRVSTRKLFPELEQLT